MSLRIAIMGIRGIPNFYGGFEQLAEHLAPGLVRAGHDVTVYNSHNHPFQGDIWEGVHIVHCYDPEYLLGSAGQFVYDLNCVMDARKRSFDVILQLGYTSSSVWGFLFPRGSKIIYNMDGLEWQRSKYSRLARRFLQYAERLAVKYSDYYVTDSPVIESYFKEKYGIRSEYIAYGADIFPEADKAVLSRYQVEQGAYYLLMARMEAENNIALVLEGFTRSGTQRKILVVGNVSNKFGRTLQARYRNDQRVIFTGGIYEQRTIHSLKFFSRMYFHGHSTGGTNPSLLEAMASKALIAAHDNAFNREVLGEDAIYFTDAAGITALIGKNTPLGQKEEMTRRNQEKILRKFNWPDIIAHYEEFMVKSLYTRNIPSTAISVSHHPHRPLAGNHPASTIAPASTPVNLHRHP